MFRFLILFCLTLTSAAWAAPTENKWKIVVGQSLGPLQVHTSRTSLDKIFQPIDLADTHSNEGPVTEICGLRPDRRFTVVWTDEKKTQIRSIQIFGELFKTPEGVGVGTTLEQLEKINGNPFVYLTPASGALVVDWQGGKLAKSYSKLRLKLSWRTPTFQKLSNKQWITLNSPGKLLSSSKLSRTLNPVVEQLYMEF